MAELRPAVATPSPAGSAWLYATACAAIAVPSLIAFNVPPSATFFNQAAAFVGWGGFLLVLGAMVPKRAWPRSTGSLSLLAAMALMLASALAAPAIADVPWSLSLSSAGTILSAMLVVAVGASATRAGVGARAFRSFCVALVVAGIASSLVGLIQVFAAGVPDGDWVALSALPGRATGNLRQPNHLSSLLLWSVVAVVWVGEAQLLSRRITTALAVVFIYVIVLSASRTGAVGTLTLAAWGLLDRRLSPAARRLLVLSPLIYAAMWWGTTAWATSHQQAFAGEARFSGAGDISNSRFTIWSHTLSLIATHPWLGVGFGNFNFAWTLTPFPQRPPAFFDHTHNLPLNFAVEMGLPLAALTLALIAHALYRALRHAIRDGRELDSTGYPVQRAAFVIVFLVAVHSMLEYPLWYSYFLLPAAFAFGLCLERPIASEATFPGGRHGTRPYVIAAMFLTLGGTLAVYDYMRVVVIFAPPSGAGPLERRIADGSRSLLFGHHADYAAATVAEHPGSVMKAFDRAPHYLLDARLMAAWARALDEQGETDKARHVAARLKEFRNEADEFFAPCRPGAPASGAVPFQCQAPTRTLRFEDFR